MRPLLSRPYVLSTDPLKRIRTALLFGAFVCLFLWAFKPFGISFLGERLAPVALGYGAVCTAVMLLLNVVMPRLMRGWFMEARWTVGRELGWTLVNVGCIGLANAVYTVAIGLAPWNLAIIGQFTMYTLLVGSFPVVLSVMLNEARLNRMHSEGSEAINAGLKERAPAAEAAPTTDPGETSISIPSETQDNSLTLPMAALCFVRSADNYVEVYHMDGRGLQRSVLRTSLKAVAEALAGHDRFMRCHKQHLVDLHKVQRVSGNAQGLRLHLEGIEDAVPVSRQLTAAVRQRLAARP